MLRLIGPYWLKLLNRRTPKAPIKKSIWSKNLISTYEIPPKKRETESKAVSLMSLMSLMSFVLQLNKYRRNKQNTTWKVLEAPPQLNLRQRLTLLSFSSISKDPSFHLVVPRSMLEKRIFTAPLLQSLGTMVAMAWYPMVHFGGWDLGSTKSWRRQIKSTASIYTSMPRLYGGMCFKKVSVSVTHKLIHNVSLLTQLSVVTCHCCTDSWHNSALTS